MEHNLAGSTRLLAAGLLALLVAAGGAEALVPVWSLTERSNYTAAALARDGSLLAAGDREV